MPKSELYDFACIIKHETPKAYLVNDGMKDHWIPKSQGEWDADSQTMTIPIWLATEKGMV